MILRVTWFEVLVVVAVLSCVGSVLDLLGLGWLSARVSDRREVRRAAACQAGDHRWMDSEEGGSYCLCGARVASR